MEKKKMSRFLMAFLLVAALLVPWMGEVTVAKAADDYYLEVVEYINSLGSDPGYTFPEASHYIVFERGGEIYYIVVSNRTPYVRITDTVSYIYIPSTHSYVEKKLDGTNWVLNDSRDNSSFISQREFSKIIKSSIDVYKYDSGEIFFLASPIILGLSEAKLVQILEQMNPLQEILLMIPIAVVCLAGYVGLRKGLALLVQLLHQA